MTRKFLAVLVAGALTATSSWAGSHCVRPRDAMAMHTAALQQNLMVAALSCGAITRYNQFVLMHQGELQQSDAVLLAFFRRENGAKGTADYHTFKTKAANDSALQSALNPGTYCADAQQAFDVALNGGAMNLASFVRSEWGMTAEYVSEICTEGSPSAVAEDSVPAPHPPIVSASADRN